MKWISVDERLPEDRKDVLVYLKGGDFRVSHCAAGGYWQIWTRELDVTHWMPLPDPPKEGV